VKGKITRIKRIATIQAQISFRNKTNPIKIKALPVYNGLRFKQ